MAVKKPRKPSSTKKSSGKKKAKISPVAKRARTLGLESMGYGRWGKNGRVTHRTSGTQLVEVKDSKHNRAVTRDGKKKAHDAHVKLAGEILQKIMKTRKAIILAQKSGNHDRVKQLETALDRLRKQKKMNEERHAKLAKRFNPVGQKKAA